MQIRASSKSSASANETRKVAQNNAAETLSAANLATVKASGYDATIKIFPVVGHTVSAEGARQAAAFLRAHFN